MTKVPLFYNRKLIIIALTFFGCILIVQGLINGFAQSNFALTTIGLGSIFIFNASHQIFLLKKYYFRFNNEKLCWRFPFMDQKNCVELKHLSYKVSTDWKCIKLTNGNQEIEIMTDGLWRRDVKLLIIQLRDYFDAEYIPRNNNNNRVDLGVSQAA